MSYNLNHDSALSDGHGVVHTEQRFSFMFPSLDALSCGLDSIQLHSAYLGRPILHATAPWGIHFPAGPTCFYIITQGCCWFYPENREPLLLEQGDMAVNIYGLAATLKDHPQSNSMHIEELLPMEDFTKRHDLTFGGGGRPTMMVCGCFFLKHSHSRLLAALPEIIHIKNENGRPVKWLEGILGLLSCEAAANHPGTSVLLNHLANILFIQAVRSYLSTPAADNIKWSTVFMDSEIQSAVNLIQESPEKPWSVALLAQKVGMSRSAFAAKFTEILGTPPMKYLLDFRMQKAAFLLRGSQYSLKQITLQVGYHSESAFSNAFKRWAKVAPGLYKKSRMQNKTSG